MKGQYILAGLKTKKSLEEKDVEFKRMLKEFWKDADGLSIKSDIEALLFRFFREAERKQEIRFEKIYEKICGLDKRIDTIEKKAYEESKGIDRRLDTIRDRVEEGLPKLNEDIQDVYTKLLMLVSVVVFIFFRTLEILDTLKGIS